MRLTELQKIKARCQIKQSRQGECWLWTGGNSGKPDKFNGGYGRTYYEGRNYATHRLTIILSGKDIPEGAEVDHKCAERSCCNPDHLEIVPQEENKRRRSQSKHVNTDKQNAKELLEAIA